MNDSIQKNSHTLQDSGLFRVALIGCGTHNQLLALRLMQNQKLTSKLSLTLFDSQSTFNQQKTISCHSTDVPPALKDFCKPLWQCSWPSYDVHFEKMHKRVEIGYHTLSLHTLSQELLRLSDIFPHSLQFCWNTQLNTLSDLEKWCTTQNTEAFDLIIDTTGLETETVPNPHQSKSWHQGNSGVQQFLGMTYRFDSDHNITVPIIMDARVNQPQDSGYSFVYVLPLSSNEVLIEDTRLIPEPVSFDLLEKGVFDYAKKIASLKGTDEKMFPVFSEIYREKGLIPIPLEKFTGSHKRARVLVQNFAKRRTITLHAGVTAEFFHPTTGYSLPLALQSVMVIEKSLLELDSVPRFQESKPESQPKIESQVDTQFDSQFERVAATLSQNYHHYCRTSEQSWNTALLFNSFLFLGFNPGQAHNAFFYFYQLPPWFISAFYGCRLRLWHLRVLLSRLPPKQFRYLQLGKCLKAWLG